MISSEFLSKTATGYFDEKLSEIYMEYQNALQGNNTLDFDDLLLKPLELFSEHSIRLEYYQKKFKYVLVDEYQDTNRPQFEFVHAISNQHRDICVVGDDDQSIYSWRGADVNNILKFINKKSDVHKYSNGKCFIYGGIKYSGATILSLS